MMQFRLILITLLFTLSFISITAQKRAISPPVPSGMVADASATHPDYDNPTEKLEIGGDSLISTTSYPMTVLGGWPLEDMSAKTVQLIGPSTDNDSSNTMPIGFMFRFDNANFTAFGVSGNGPLSLGRAPFGPLSFNQITQETDFPKIMPYWDDLCVGPNGKVHYKTIGSPGSRKLIVEWQNMEIARAGPCSGQGAGIFQLWLFEKTGVIQFVYGDGMTGATPLDSYSIGLQSGPGTNFASVTAATNSVSYTVANDAQSTAIPTGTSYLFAPPMPPAPSSGSVTSITQTSLQLNWTDNSSTETMYQISRSTDNVNFTVIATPPPNTANFVDSSLTPGTQYFYRVNALSEGAFGDEIALSATTHPAGNITSTSTGGMWSAPGTWAGAVVPSVGDNVTIVDGALVTIDNAASALSLTVGTTGSLAENDDYKAAATATLTFEETAPHSLTVTQNVLVKSGGIFATFGLGNIIGHVLTIGGNLTNNGALDFSTNNNMAGANITFTGVSDNIFGGTGAVTDVRTITISKGTSNVNILELNPAVFTVQGSAVDGPGSGFLTITNGTFKISGNFTGNHRTFSTASYNIPSSGGIWLNNPNYTVAAQNASASVSGMFRVSSGTYNVGTLANDSLAFNPNTRVTIDGGAITTSGRFGVTAPATIWHYTQSGGTITACTSGNTSTTLACFDTGTFVGSSFITMTGGEIVIQNRSTAASGPRDYRNVAGVNGMNTITGGKVKFGNNLTTGATTFIGAGNFPNLEINNTTGGHSLLLQSVNGRYNETRDVTINPGTTLNTNNATFVMYGSTFTNNGTLAVPGTMGYFVLSNRTGNTLYTGTGVSTGIITHFMFEGQNVIFAPGINNIRVRNLYLFTGNIINANKLTLGNNDTINSVVQFGNEDDPSPAGTLDSAPVFNLGTGGQSVRYLRTGSARTTGPEINPSRVLTSFTYDNNDPATDELTIDGGDLTITGAMLLTNGEIKTGANKITHNGTVTRVNGFINGTLTRTYTAQQSHYIYHLGANGYSPVFFFVGFLAMNPSTLSVKVVDAALPGLDPATAASRHWEIVKTGNITGRWEFVYTDADVVGDETTYGAWGAHGGTPVLETGPNNPATNTVVSLQPLSDVSGNWGIGHLAQPRTLSGTVRTAGGMPIRNAILRLSGGGLTEPMVTQTGSLGQYVFNNVLTGTPYTLSVSAKRFRFTPTSNQIVIIGDGFPQDFTANAQFEGVVNRKAGPKR